MLARFPKAFFDSPEVRLLTSAETVLAYFRLSTEIQKGEGFLTEHTLVFVFNGEKQFHFPECDITVGADELILLKRGTYYMSAFMPAGQEYRALMLCLDDDFLRAFWRKYPPSVATDRTAYFPEKVYCDKSLQQIRDSLLHYMEEGNSRTSELVRLKLEELFLVLLSGPTRETISRFLQHLFDKHSNAIDIVMRSNLFKPFTLEEYARMCNMSLSTFKREFQKIYELPPREWINKERLDHADFLLRSTDKQVNEVADECGFEHVSYFIKCYKAKFGTTPKSTNRAKIASF